MPREVIYGNDARQKLKKGLDTVADAVKVTLGPKGRRVVIDRGSNSSPTVTKDGVTVAKAVRELQDNAENLGAALLREVSSKTNDVAGDGTTSAAVLAQALVSEGFKLLATDVSVPEMLKTLETDTAATIAYLQEHAKEIKTIDEVRHVASISAADPAIGAIIAEAVFAASREMKNIKDVALAVETSKTIGVTYQMSQGAFLSKGMISLYMATNKERLIAEYEDIPVLITDKKLINAKEIAPLLEKMYADGQHELLIICDGMDGDALATAVVNKARGNFHILGVQCPGFGDRKKDNYDDFALLTGATVVSEHHGIKIENATQEHLGRVAKVISTRDQTTLIGGAGDPAKIDERVLLLRNVLKEKENLGEFDKEKLREQIARLAGGIALIKVGAATDTAMLELRHRVEDAVCATRAAIDGGILPGGGIPLLRAGEELGNGLLKKALSSPIKQIAENGGKNGDMVVERVLAKEEPSYGYNAATDEYGDLLLMGVIDPCKVVCCALRNAVEIASLILGSEACITDIPLSRLHLSNLPRGGRGNPADEQAYLT